MKEIVLATNNEHKLKEFKEILPNYKIISLEDIGYTDDIEETGTTFQENAKIKADTIHNYLVEKKEKKLVVADDSGWCCVALNNNPGIYSARYAGNHDFQANRDKLRIDLKGKSRDAFFCCCICLEDEDGNTQFFEGKTEGEIIDEERGSKGFGYDSIFFSKDLQKTFGEATEEEKNSVSHRKRAIEQLKKAL